MLTFTAIQKPPEIYFLFFSEGALRFCNIDDKKIVKEVPLGKDHALEFDLLKRRDSYVKIIG
jgi:hypothetical protein